jgi:rhodanese-related sulfurtransferase
MGYQNVYWYREGLKGWKKAGHPARYTIKFKSDPPPAIEPSALQKKILEKEKMFLVDIRDEMSISKFGRIDGPTLHYPLYRFHSLCWELPKKRLLVIFDIRGKQAPNAARYLLQKYFDRNRVTWLKGGIEAWTKLGLPMMREK